VAVSARPVLAFVHINKTAGTTLRFILRSSYGARHCDVEPWHGRWEDPPFSADDLQRVRKLYPGLASIAGHRVFGYPDLEAGSDDVRYLTILREPIAMCASRFQYQHDYRGKRELVFEEWIERDWVRNAQTQRVAGTSDPNEAIEIIERKEMFVGLTERFDESIVMLKAMRAPDLDIRYSPVNVAKSSTIAKDLLADPAKHEMIVAANQADIELYRYAREELYPRLQREFGPTLDQTVAQAATASRKFNRWNLGMCWLKQHAVHRPALRVHRARHPRRMTGEAFSGDIRARSAVDASWDAVDTRPEGSEAG
jgi:hypothetical protein